MTFFKRLVQILVVEQAHPQVPIRGAIVDGPHGQVHVDGIHVTLQGETVADLQATIVGEPASNRRAVLVGLEVRKLAVGNMEFVQDLEDRVGIDGELPEGHRLVMILAAEPAKRGSGEHAFHPGDFRDPADRHHAGEAGSIHGDDAIEDPVRLRSVLTHVEERQQDHHQEQGDARRSDGEQRPDGIPPGVTEDVGEVFHDATETRVS